MERLTIDTKYQERLDRLATYEDTGLTPEEIIEMKSAWKAVCKECGINRTQIENEVE